MSRNCERLRVPTLFERNVSGITMRTKLPLLLVIAAAIVLPLMMDAQTRRSGRSTSTNIDRDGPVTNCGDIHVTYDRRPAITEETDLTLPPSQVSTLRVQLSNEGLYLNGWDRNDYSIK